MTAPLKDRLSAAQFWVWNTLGALAWSVGVSIGREGGLINRLGLWLCGLAGSFDGKADDYR